MFKFNFLGVLCPKPRADNWPQSFFDSVTEIRKEGLMKDEVFRITNGPSERKALKLVRTGEEYIFSVEELKNDGTFGPIEKIGMCASHFSRARNGTIILVEPPLRRVQFDPETGVGVFVFVM